MNDSSPIFLKKINDIKVYLNNNFLSKIEKGLNIVTKEKPVFSEEERKLATEFYLAGENSKNIENIGYFGIRDGSNNYKYIFPSMLFEDKDVYLRVNVLNLLSTHKVDNENLIELIFNIERFFKYHVDYVSKGKDSRFLELVIDKNKDSDQLEISYNYSFFLNPKVINNKTTINIKEKFDKDLFYQQYSCIINEKFDLNINYESFIENEKEMFKTLGLIIY